MSAQAEVAIVGAGPHGLACAAFLRAAGVDPAILGEPMGFWRERMPECMLLRSRRRSSHIADPDGSLSLDAFEEAEGISLAEPLRLSDFIRYGLWYQRCAAPDVDRRRVIELEPLTHGFRLRLDDGGSLEARRVVIAGGLGPFAWCPAPLQDLPRELVSHSADHRRFDGFRGQRVLVVGAGQSALESAALLHEAGASVEVIAREGSLVWLGKNGGTTPRARLRMAILPPTDVGGRVTGWIAAAPDLFRHLPPRPGSLVGRRCTVPAGAGWLFERLRAVPMTLGRRVVVASPTAEGVRVKLDDGSEREADQVLMGTGWRIDVSRYEFLGASVVDRLARRAGYPVLGRGMESSVPGLHFVGAPAAASFGPVMRFVVGSWYAAPVLTRAVVGRRQRPLRLSYRPRIGAPVVS